MSIGQRLVEFRHNLIRGHVRGFDPNPAIIPPVNQVPNFPELRVNKFVSFKRELETEKVVVVKVLNAMDVPQLPEAVLVTNLNGDTHLINVRGLSEMTEQELCNDEDLQELKEILGDPQVVRIVENVADVIKLGEKIRQPLEAESFVILQEWDRLLRPGFLPSIQLEYPNKYEQLVAPFRGGATAGWNWDLQEDPTKLTPEQGRLIYALSSSLVSLALNGIVERLYATPSESLPYDQLSSVIHEALNEELLADIESERMDAIKIRDDGAEEKEKPRIRFRIVEGVTLFESLPFGLTRYYATATTKKEGTTPLIPHRRFIQDFVTWEESLDFVIVVPEAPT